MYVDCIALYIMAESTLISIRLPNDLLEKVDQRVEALKLSNRGMNRTYLVIDALEQILGITSNDLVFLSNTVLDSSEIDQKIENAVAPLRVELDALKNQINLIKSAPIASSPKRSTPRAKVERVADVNKPDSPTCPNCQSTETRYRGRGQLRADGTRNYRYGCKSCKKTFATDPDRAA